MFWSLIIRGGGIMITLIQVPLLLDIMQQEKYGVWLTLLNVVNWISVFDLGITNGLRNKLSELYINQNQNDARKYIFNVFSFLFLFFLLIFIIFKLFETQLNFQSLFNTKKISENQLSNIFNIVFSGIIFRFIFQIPVVLETAKGYTHVSNALLLTGNILGIIFLYIRSVLSSEMIELSTVGFSVVWIPNILYLIYFLWFIFHDNRIFMPRWSEFDLPFIKPLMKISFHFFLIQLTALIIFASIPFILSQLLNPSHATEYNLANSIFNIPLLVMGVLCNPITPLVTQAFVQSDKKWLRQILRKFNFYALILISITWILFLFSQSIYGLWIGNKVSINGGLVFWIAIYTSVNLFLQPYTNIYNGIGKLGVVAFLSPIGVCIFLFSAYYLTNYFNNSTGVVMGLILSSLIGLIYIPVKVFKEIRNL